MERHTTFFRAGGTMEPNAPSYIVRAADAQLLEALLKREYVFLLDSRQKGKSSLVGRTMLSLKAEGVIPIKLDLQRIGVNVSPEQWYAGLLTGVGQELGLETEIFAFWEAKQSIGPLARWVGALESVVLAKTTQPLVIFVDEVDFVRGLPFTTDEFFAGIRDCYNRRYETPGFDRLTFCLVGVATPGQLIRNPEITPFNIGTRINLSDFTVAETNGYATVLNGAGRSGTQLLMRVHHWVNGHPYLTQLLCDEIASRGADVDVTVERLLLCADAKQHLPNLADVERRMLNPDCPGLSNDEARIQVLELYRKMLRGRPVGANDENPITASLRLSGIGGVDADKLVVRNRVYRRVFNERWVESNLPDAERRRQKAAARAGALRVTASATALATLFAALALYSFRLSSERGEAIRETRRLALATERRAYSALMYVISDQAAKNNWIRVTELLDKTAASPVKGWEWEYWRAKVNSNVRSFSTPSGKGIVTYFSDGGAYAVTTPGRVQSSLGDVTSAPLNNLDQAEWLMQAYSRIASSRGTSGLRLVPGVPLAQSEVVKAVSPTDGSILRANLKRFTIAMYDRRGAPLWRRHSVDGTAFSAAFSPNGRTIVFAAENELEFFDTRTGRRQWRVPIRGCNQPRFSPDGALVAVPTEANVTFLVEVEARRVKQRLTGHIAPVAITAFSHQGERLATCANDGVIMLWDVRSGHRIGALIGHRSLPGSVAFSPKGDRLVSRSEDGEVREWLLAQTSPDRVLSGHSAEVSRLEVSPDGTRIATGSMDGTVIVWNVADGSVLRRVNAGAVVKAHAIGFSQDGKMLAVSSGKGSVILLDSRSGQTESRLTGHKAQVNKVQFCDGDRKLFTVSDDGTASIWDLPSGNRLMHFAPRSRVMAACVDATASRIAAALKDYSVVEVDSKSQSEIGRWHPHSNRIYAIEYSPDCNLIATTSYDGNAALILQEGKRVVMLKGHQNRVWQATFSPNGKRLLTNSFDGTARLWDTKTGDQLAVLRHDSWVASAEFSPSARRIITCSADSTVRIWDPDSGDELATLRGHGGAVFRAKMSRDESYLASASLDATIRLWRLDKH